MFKITPKSWMIANIYTCKNIILLPPWRTYTNNNLQKNITQQYYTA